MTKTVNLDALKDASYRIENELVWNNGELVGYTRYVPTDLSVATVYEEEEFYGGFVPEENGVCEVCHMVRAKNGSCEC